MCENVVRNKKVKSLRNGIYSQLKIVANEIAENLELEQEKEKISI